MSHSAAAGKKAKKEQVKRGFCFVLSRRRWTLSVVIVLVQHAQTLVDSIVDRRLSPRSPRCQHTCRKHAVGSNTVSAMRNQSKSKPPPPDCSLALAMDLTRIGHALLSLGLGRLGLSHVITQKISFVDSSSRKKRICESGGQKKRNQKKSFFFLLLLSSPCRRRRARAESRRHRRSRRATQSFLGVRRRGGDARVRTGRNAQEVCDAPHAKSCCWRGPRAER
jgi:hypothetical protein